MNIFSADCVLSMDLMNGNINYTQRFVRVIINFPRIFYAGSYRQFDSAVLDNVSPTDKCDFRPQVISDRDE